MAGVSPAPKQGPQKHSRKMPPAETISATAAVFDQLQIGGHAVRVDAEFELAVAAALAADDVHYRADVFISAAGTASDDALLHVDAAIGTDLVHQVHVDLAAQLLVGLVFGRLQNLFSVGFQFADGVGIAGVHRQRDHAARRWRGPARCSRHSRPRRRVSALGRLRGGRELHEIPFVTSSVCQMEDQAGGLGCHDVDAVAVISGEAWPHRGRRTP